MKRWHMEGIISTGRTGHKLQIPHPGERTIWSPSTAGRTRAEFFLVKVMRVVRESVQRQF